MHTTSGVRPDFWGQRWRLVMQKEQTDEKVLVRAQSDVIFGPWEHRVRIPVGSPHLETENGFRKSRRARIWRDARLCSKCGSLMISSRYRRQVIRFLSAYRCSVCSHRFEQETRGYQGFYWSCLLCFALVASFLISQYVLSSLQLFVLGLVFFLLLVPVYRNIWLFKTEKVAARFGGSRLLPDVNGRRLYGRILGGDSKLLGFLLGLGVVAFFVTVGFSAVIAVTAAMA